MSFGAALWVACVAAEVAALAAAVRATLRAAGPGKPVSRSGTASVIDGGARVFRAPLVLLLAFALASDLVIAGGRELLLVGAARPFAGLARAWWHVETLLVIAWPLGLAAASWEVFPLRPRPVRWPLAMLGAWALVLWAPLVLAHPVRRGAVAGVLLVAELAGLGAGAVAVARGWRYPWGPPHAALVVLLSIELVIAVLGPFGHDVFRSWAVLGRAPYAVGFAVVAAVLGAGGRRAA